MNNDLQSWMRHSEDKEGVSFGKSLLLFFVVCTILVASVYLGM